MAVWDLNSNLDVFGMQTFLRGLIYVGWAIQAHLSLVSFEGTCTPTSKISGRGTIILGHGKWDMCHCLNHITESEQYCVALLFSNKTLFKTLCMFLSGGHSPGNIKYCFNVCLYQVHVSLLFWSDKLSELSPSLSSVVDTLFCLICQ